MYIEMSDGVSLYVKHSGEGLPCIFVHGGPGEGSLDFEVVCGNTLESFMHIIYYDQRGSARSGGAADDDYSIDRHVEDIEEIRKKLGVTKVILLAHSFGGIIATNYAYKYQNSVDKLILLNSTLDLMDSLKNQTYYGEKILSCNEFASASYQSDFEKWKEIVGRLIEKDLFYQLQYDKYTNFIKLNSVNNQIENFNATMANQALNNEDYFRCFFNLTEKINIPVLIITGNEDYAIGPNHYTNFLFPNKKIIILQGKHMSYLENQEEVIFAIRNFIEM
jgi:proline iminopeptidase